MSTHERVRRPAVAAVRSTSHGRTTERPAAAPTAIPGFSYARSAAPPLRMTEVDDPLEHEADGLAAAIAQRPAGPVHPSAAPAGSSPSQPLDTRLSGAIEGQRGRGRPLPGGVRQKLEPLFGVDLGAVRLHDGPPADAVAQLLDAEAFTVGRDVFVRGQRDLTASSEGREVLTHELAHVAQQQGGPPVVQRLPRPEWLKRLARRLRPANAGPAETPYQPIPGFPGGDRPHRFSGAYGVPIPVRYDDEPEGGHYNTIPSFDDEPEGGHYNTIPNFDDEPEGGHYNTIPSFDDEPEGGHYNTIPDISASRRLSGPYGMWAPASDPDLARRLADVAVGAKKPRKRVRFAV